MEQVWTEDKINAHRRGQSTIARLMARFQHVGKTYCRPLTEAYTAFESTLFFDVRAVCHRLADAEPYARLETSTPRLPASRGWRASSPSDSRRLSRNVLQYTWSCRPIDLTIGEHEFAAAVEGCMNGFSCFYVILAFRPAS